MQSLDVANGHRWPVDLDRDLEVHGEIILKFGQKSDWI